MTNVTLLGVTVTLARPEQFATPAGAQRMLRDATLQRQLMKVPTAWARDVLARYGIPHDGTREEALLLLVWYMAGRAHPKAQAALLHYLTNTKENNHV